MNKAISIILRILGAVFLPIKRNLLFFVFIFILCYATTQLEVPETKGAQPYPLAAAELFIDVYIISIVLALFPLKIRRWLRALVYLAMYSVTIIDVYCFVKFSSTLTPTMLLLVGETNGSEASEFLSSYISWDIINSEVGWILLIMLIHIGINIASLFKKRFAIHHIRLHHDADKIVCGILGALCILQLVDSYKLTLPNKVAMVRLMSYNTIGEVENELTRKDKATLYLPIYRFIFSVYANHLTSRQVNTLIDGIDKVKVDSCSFSCENIVLIIGESANRRHSELYGYPHHTTPGQMELKRSGQMAVFTDAVAPWNLTSFVFKHLFSMYAVGDSGEWCDYPLFPEIFRKAGYKVTFVTNQFLPQAKEAVYDFSGGFFLNNPELSKAMFDVRNVQLFKYDGGLIKNFDEISHKQDSIESLSSDSIIGKGNLTIVHLKGQHVGYREKYPRSRKKFTHDDYEYLAAKNLNKRNRMLLADYDNATLYNDSILREIVRRYEDREAVVIYLSDHGEEAWIDGKPIYGRNHSMKVDYQLAQEEFAIPMWIWCSKKYIGKHSEIYQQIWKARRKRFMSDALPHTLLHIAGIYCPWFREEYDILSYGYDEMRPRILKHQADFDVLREEFNHIKK